MTIRLRAATLLALVLGALGCRCDEKYQPAALSKDAEAIFSRAELEGPGGSLVVDLEQLRVLGFLRTTEAQTGGAVTDLLMFLLPGVAAELKDDPAGPVVARSAILVGLMRAWAPWPHVERVGLLAPAPMPGQDLSETLGGITLVVATKDGLEANRELVAGLAAMDRASGAPQFRADGDDTLCTTSTDLPLAICVRAGDGYLALSSPSGVKALLPGEGSPRPALPPPFLARLRVEVPLVGRGTLTVSGDAAVKVAAHVETSDPKGGEQLEKLAQEYLARLDKNRADSRAAITPAYEQTRSALAADAKTPARLKQVSANTTLDELLDPGATYQKLRESIHVARKDGTVDVDLTVPEQTIRRVRDDSSVLTSVVLAGMASTVAVPAIGRYQCKSRQAEVAGVLASIKHAQSSFGAAHEGASAASFEELAGFKPPQKRLYTYCLGANCLECTTKDCAKLAPELNPCVQRVEGLDSESTRSRSACAVGDPSGSGALDVWIVDDAGEVVNLENGCE